MSAGFRVHDPAYLESAPPDPKCCSDGRILCARCARKAISAMMIRDDEDGLTNNADGFNAGELDRYLSGLTQKRGGRVDPDDDGDKLEVPAMTFDDVFADRQRGRKWRQTDALDLDAGDPLPALRMDD